MRIFKNLTDILGYATDHAAKAEAAAKKYDQAAAMLRNGFTKAEVARAMGFRPISRTDCERQASRNYALAFAYEDIATAFEECQQYNELPEDE